MIRSYTLITSLLIRSTRSSLILKQKCSISTKPTGDSSVNRFTERSHNCGQLTRADIGQRVNLFGWVKYTRFDNKIIALRDSYGTVQCIVDKSKLTRDFRQTAIHNESVLRVSGIVQARPSKQINNDQTSGEIEVLADQVGVVSEAKKDLPILTRESNQEVTLVNRLKYRYLDIRGAKLQEALRFRSKLCGIVRRQLEEFGFVDCETPTLFRRTPGGANEFIVPTQTSNMFYGLTQSPQQLKQLLMIGGLDRYYQICRCYRDETGRTDRQPEFTQLDIELSFTNQELIMDLINQLLYRLFTKLADETNIGLQPSSTFDKPNHIERMSFQDAFSKYGSDKPDTRFGWLIEETDTESLSVTIPLVVDQDIIAKTLELVRSEKNFDTEFQVISDVSSIATKVTIEGKSKQNRDMLGALRVKLASELENQGQQIYDRKFKFVWITEFPLFTVNENTGELESNHHPFTSPTDDTMQYLKTDPTKVIGQHYDLVLNGQEVGGGSIRIYDADLQRFVFADILKLNEKTFEYFIQALKSGCPPHGGIALGLDRLIAILLDRDSIREVIAFPKSGTGRDLMSESPHEIDKDTKKMYHIESTSESQ